MQGQPSDTQFFNPSTNQAYPQDYHAGGRGTSSSSPSAWMRADTLVWHTLAFPVTGSRIRFSDNGDITWELPGIHLNRALDWAYLQGAEDLQARLAGAGVYNGQPATLSRQSFPGPSMSGMGSTQFQHGAPITALPRRPNEPRVYPGMPGRNESAMPSSAGRPVGMETHMDAHQRASGYTAPERPMPNDPRMQERMAQGYTPGLQFAPTLPPSDDDVHAEHYSTEMEASDGRSRQSRQTRSPNAQQSRPRSVDSVLSERTASSHQSLVYLYGGDNPGLALTRHNMRVLWGGGQNAPSPPSITQRTNPNPGSPWSP